MAILTKHQTLLLLTLPDLECLIVHELFTSTELKQQEIDNTKSHEGSIVWRNDSRYFAINVPVFSGNIKNTITCSITVYTAQHTVQGSVLLVNRHPRKLLGN
jgi:hypothetical protein